MITAKALLQKLPPLTNNSVLIEKDQEIHDIVKEVLDAHNFFSNDYDVICKYFLYDNIFDTCEELFDFLKKYVKYRIEPEADQTTKSPGALLVTGQGDCKHYAGFIAGILDGLKRNGYDIDWRYRFASYSPGSKTIGHVFVVVKENGKEIWVDPVLSRFNERLQPTYSIDKKIDTMLRRVAGMENMVNGFEKTVNGITVQAVPNIDQLNYDGSHRYEGIFNPYLGLSAYRDFGGDQSISNINDLAAQLNALIATGPEPGHTVTPAFVQWVYDSSIRSWNFYYNSGVKPGFSADSILPINYPRPVFTEDNRLIFDPAVPLDDTGNAEVHILNAWLQDLVNGYAQNPWPVKPQEIKEFSQGRRGDNFLMQTRTTHDNWLSDLGKELNKAINFVKEGILKIAGSIPRNSFLALVGLNVFHFADHLQEKINSGGWDSIANTWQDIGGNPDKLRNTIEKGSKVPAVDDQGKSIGAVQVAAIMAAAAPIVAIMLKYLDKSGKAGEIVAASIPLLASQFPDIDFTPLANGLYPINRRTGQQIQWQIDDIDNENLGGGNNALPGDNDILTWARNNPEITAAGIATVTHFLVNTKGKKPNYIIPLLAGAGTYLLLKKSLGSSTTTLPKQLPKGDSALSTADKRAALLNWNAYNTTDQQSSIDQFEELVSNQFTDQEINAVYSMIFDYYLLGKDVPQGSTLYNELNSISIKYQIFT